MNTNFFNQIQQLDFTGVLQLNISKGAESNLIVSVLLNNEQCGDSAKNLIPPLTFNATPQEFDEGFFEQITTYTNRFGLNGGYGKISKANGRSQKAIGNGERKSRERKRKKKPKTRSLKTVWQRLTSWRKRANSVKRG
jgi:PRTRC genetic system protein E